MVVVKHPSSDPIYYNNMYAYNSDGPDHYNIALSNWTAALASIFVELLYEK